MLDKDMGSPYHYAYPPLGSKFALWLSGLHPELAEALGLFLSNEGHCAYPPLGSKFAPWPKWPRTGACRGPGAFFFLVQGGTFMNTVAILIDGGFFLKRLPYVRKDVDMNDAHSIHLAIQQLVRGHLSKLNKRQQASLRQHGNNKGVNSKQVSNLMIWEPNRYAQLYRCFYYDALPYGGTGHRPISHEFIDYSKSDTSKLRHALFRLLRSEPNFALRLGRTAKNPEYMWNLKPKVLRELVQGKRQFGDLTDNDFQTSIRQKGVDIRLGTDMTSLALKKQANVLVLVTGDSDFVPAAKLARREGCRVILDPLYLEVSPDLFEHIDQLTSGFYRPKRPAARTR